MNVVAVIPVKPLAQAKSRLAPYLKDVQRRRLVITMLRRVIRAAREASDEVWVLGADDSTRNVALKEGASWREDAGSNINESLRLIFEEAWTAGKSPLFLPGDLPFLCSDELKGLIAHAGSGDDSDLKIVLSPANKGGGTNAIFIPQRLLFRLQLGPDSLSLHVSEARRLGLEPTVYASTGLARDLDTWEDLQEYETHEPGFLARLTRGEGGSDGSFYSQTEI